MHPRPWLGTVEMRTFVDDPLGRLVPLDEADGLTEGPGTSGGVELVVHGRTLIDAAQRTDVDQLWAYLATMVDKLATGASCARTPFPDASARLGVALQHDDTVVVVLAGPERRRAVADRHVLFEALCRAGVAFADHGERLGRAAPAGLRQTFLECLDGLDRGEWPAVRVPGSAGPAAVEDELKEFFGVHRLAW